MNALPPKKQLQLVWPCISIKEGRWAYWEVVAFPRCGWPTQCMLLDMSHFKGNGHSWSLDIAVFRRYWYVPWYSTWTSYTNCTFISSAMYLSPMYIILHNSCFSVFQINIWYTQVCTASFTLQPGAQDCPRASGWSTAQGGQVWRKAAGSEKCLEGTGSISFSSKNKSEVKRTGSVKMGLITFRYTPCKAPDLCHAALVYWILTEKQGH